MWDDRFLFVISALAAMGLWLAFDQKERAEKAGQPKPLSWLTGCSVILIVIVIVGGRLWLYGSDLSFPNTGNIIAILIGAVFGSFTAKFVRSLFAEDFGKRDPIVGAAVLALLSIAYSLPLYSQAIAGFLSGIGLSSIKTPVIELTLRESAGARAHVTSASGSPQSAQFAAQAVPTANDPAPGLGWLASDTKIKCEKEKGKFCSTVSGDRQYITYLENLENSKDTLYQTVQSASEPFLMVAQKLSICLNEYVEIVPDSQLLLVDIKPIIETLFKFHTNAKRELAFFSKERKKDGTMLYDSLANSKFVEEVNAVIRGIKGKFQISDACKEASAMPPDAKFYYLQPYGALILSDLLVAHGALDEAVRVLAEWLNNWTIWQNTMGKSHDLPTWFEIRVASRLALYMKNLAGQTNIAYREFFQYYKTIFEHYVSKSSHAQRLDLYPSRCKFWTDTPNVPNLETEKRIFYLLLANEDEELRTQISFLSEESNFEALEKLFHRARFMANIPQECLPDELLSADSRKGYVADHQITAGLLGLAVADRMASIARSRGDRDRARDIRRVAEDQLRQGWEDLRPLVIGDRNKNRDKHWSQRIFAESKWESSASLATRALSQLRNADY